MTNSSWLERDDSHSEILELEPIPVRQIDLPPQSASNNGKQQMKVPTIVKSIEIGSTGEVFNITAELDVLIKTLEQATTPQPPQPDKSLEIARSASVDNKSRNRFLKHWRRSLPAKSIQILNSIKS